MAPATLCRLSDLTLTNWFRIPRIDKLALAEAVISRLIRQGL